jgi:heterodisulfide reductase subunit A-like polyferredoxin
VGKSSNVNLSINEPIVRVGNSYKESLMSQKTVGSVMVVGGGIAGMQAALDLADSGYLVHLVEKSSAIGGVMSELDKTFPTNDCAM